MLLSMLARLGFDGSAYYKGLAKAQLAAKEFGVGAKKYFTDAVSGSIGKYLAAGSAFAAFAGLSVKLVESAREIKNWSEQLDISTDDVQRLMKVARRSGLEFEQMARGMEKFGEARAKALEGDPEKLAIFAKFGLSASQLRPSSTTNLDAINQMMAHIGGRPMTAGERTTMGSLFGRHGERLIAPFERLAQMGEIKLIEQKDIEALHQFKGSIDSIGKSLQIATAGIVASGARLLKSVANPDELEELERKRYQAMLRYTDTIGDPFTQMINAVLGNSNQATLKRQYEDASAALDEYKAKQRAIGIRNIKDAEPFSPDFMGEGGATTGKATRIPFARDADTLAKQGLFVGGAGNPMVNLQQRQLDATRDTLNEIRGLRRDVQQRL